MKEKTESLEIEKQDLQAELKKLKLVKIINHTKEDVKNLLGEYLDGNINDIEYQRKIINKFVNSVYIFDDKIAIYYNLFNLRKFTFEEATENIAENEKFLFQNDCSAKHNLNRNVRFRFLYIINLFNEKSIMLYYIILWRVK